MLLLGGLLCLIMGLILGLLGGGGSILTVPILVYCFHLPPSIATGYSLFIVGITSLISAWRYKRHQVLNMKVATIFALPATLGVLISRRVILPAMSESYLLFRIHITKDQIVMLTFASMMIVIASVMIRPKKSPSSSTTTSHNPVPYGLIAIEGIGVGMITGFVGAGGGFLIVPALTLMARLRMRAAIATSLLIISIKSLIGFFGDAINGPPINVGLLVSLSSLTVIGSYIGVKWNTRLSATRLRIGFAYFVFIIGLVIAINELSTILAQS